MASAGNNKRQKTEPLFKEGGSTEAGYFRVTEGREAPKNLFQESDYAGLKRVGLLKKVEEISGKWFRETVISSHPPEYTRAIFQSDLAGIEEFSDTWYRLIDKKMERMKCCRDLIIRVLEELGDGTGFTDFERRLIIGCARISGSYDDYYFAYLKAVQADAIRSVLADSPPDPTTQKECYSHYTVVQWSAESRSYSATPFATFFAPNLVPVLQAFGALIRDLQTVPGGLSTEQQAYVVFFEQYQRCLGANAGHEELEAMWTELDCRWMETQGPIQIVHDIETGYGDPLRRKATPDFSLRFLDDSFAKENETIARIQGHMMEYYSARNTPIAKDGLTALGNTSAGIYYIPFKTGIALQFSFSGQSIPNRVQVKVDKGVKIYFDAVETQARVAQNVGLVRKAFGVQEAEALLAKYKPEAVEQLVWHVAAHEVGHAIYNLKTVESTIAKEGPDVVTLLEESRAELTAMFTLHLLYKKEMLTLEHLKACVAHFCLDGCRYFAKWKSEALRPYIIFQIYAYKTYRECGYLRDATGAGRLLTIDDSKTLEALSHFSERFETILKHEDDANGAALQALLDDMAKEDDFVKAVVSRLFEG